MSPNVLVVEEHADLRSAVVSALKREHYVCDGVRSSDEAVAMLRDHHYAAVLLAPLLPVNEDPVVRYVLAHDPAEMPTVILMADPGAPESAGNYATLVKPFNREQLIAEMAKTH
ncbi:MAG TPA: hypothetical protein VF980_07080 [Thermoanaerobaculia bacterium]